MAAMTRRQIAVVCYAAGLTFVGANVVSDAIGRRFFDCDPDPYFPEPCAAQQWAIFGILVACWLVGTYLVARREAIGPFACVFMGSMLWLGIAAGYYLRTVVTLGSWADAFSDFWSDFLVGTISTVLIIGLLTAAVGYPMQAVIHALRRRRVSA
jgi:hypothetical protein